MYQYLVGAPGAQAAGEIAAQVDAALDSGGSSAVEVPAIAQAGNGSVRRFDTDECEYVYLLNTPKMAPLNARGVAARVAEQEGAEVRRTFMARMFDVSQFQIAALQIMREFDRYTISPKGRNEIERQLSMNARRHILTKMAFLYHMFFTTTIYVNKDGFLSASSTNAIMSFSSGIPSTHRARINPGSGNLLGTSWANPDADIPLMIDAIMAQADKEGVERPRIAFANGADKYIFRSNNKVIAWYHGAGENLERSLSAETFEINGLKIHFSQGNFNDAAGTATPWVPAGSMAMFPDLGDWFLQAVGLEWVPAEATQSADPFGLLETLRPVYGDFSYAALVNNPVLLNVFMGSNFWYGFREPEAVWTPTIVF